MNLIFPLINKVKKHCQVSPQYSLDVINYIFAFILSKFELVEIKLLIQISLRKMNKRASTEISEL